jgi:hypothetical protein
VTLATRADIEAVRGPVHVERMLGVAEDPAADESTRAGQRLARLTEALQAGDDLIRQFLDLDQVLASPIATQTCRRLAIGEALYFLALNSEAGASEGDESAAKMRRVDLAHMRDRKQWPGAPDGQQTVTSAYVEAGSDFASTKLTGLT